MDPLLGVQSSDEEKKLKELAQMDAKLVDLKGNYGKLELLYKTKQQELVEKASLSERGQEDLLQLQRENKSLRDILTETQVQFDNTKIDLDELKKKCKAKEEELKGETHRWEQRQSDLHNLQVENEKLQQTVEEKQTLFVNTKKIMDELEKKLKAKEKEWKKEKTDLQVRQATLLNDGEERANKMSLLEQRISNMKEKFDFLKQAYDKLEGNKKKIEEKLREREEEWEKEKCHFICCIRAMKTNLESETQSSLDQADIKRKELEAQAFGIKNEVGQVESAQTG